MRWDEEWKQYGKTYWCCSCIQIFIWVHWPCILKIEYFGSYRWGDKRNQASNWGIKRIMVGILFLCNPKDAHSNMSYFRSSDNVWWYYWQSWRFHWESVSNWKKMDQLVACMSSQSFCRQELVKIWQQRLASNPLVSNQLPAKQ